MSLQRRHKIKTPHWVTLVLKKMVKLLFFALLKLPSKFYFASLSFSLSLYLALCICLFLFLFAFVFAFVFLFVFVFVFVLLAMSRRLLHFPARAADSDAPSHSGQSREICKINKIYLSFKKQDLSGKLSAFALALNQIGENECTASLVWAAPDSWAPESWAPDQTVQGPIYLKPMAWSSCDSQIWLYNVFRKLLFYWFIYMWC